jgi:hypothetical protein
MGMKGKAEDNPCGRDLSNGVELMPWKNNTGRTTANAAAAR